MSNASDYTPGKTLPRAEGVAFCVIFVVEFVAIVVLNVLTIIIFRRDPNLRQAKFLLLVNLAVADLLVGIVCGPFWTFDLAFSFDLWPAPHHISLLWRQLLLEMADYGKSASLTSLTMIALERMFATLHPVKYRKMSRRTRHVLIANCWGIAALFPLNYLAAAVLNIIPPETALCLILAAMYFLLLVTSLCHVAVWVKVKSSPHGGETSERELKLTSSLFIVTVVSLATWLPNQVSFSIQMIRMVRDPKSVSIDTFNRANNVAAMLLFANSLINPIIYAFRIPHFKKTFMKIFFKSCSDREGIQLNKPEPPAHWV